MLFNSIQYLFFFLPVAVLGYWGLRSAAGMVAAKVWLVAASLLFYSFWLPEYLPIILVSIAVNFCAGRLLAGGVARGALQKIILILGVCFNLGLLGYYKYADFFIVNVSTVLGIDDPGLLSIVLPIGISFYTFQQIAFLVDCYRGEGQLYSAIDYCLFVSFFPQLIAGPIVHHREMMPQFERIAESKANWNIYYSGLFLLALGLFKKMAVADTFAVWVNQGYSDISSLGFWSSWRTSLSYSIQLYFDFSGYTDMAIGAGRLFQIELPQNFISPYRALDIRDFWRRWHVTLGRFLAQYLYIPLGGNRNGTFFTCLNLFITFVLCGLWHGAGWTFVIWGGLHGGAMIVHRLWKLLGGRMPRMAAWLVTMLFVNAAWVVFRAPDIESALSVLKAMVAVDGTIISTGLAALSGNWFVLSNAFVALVIAIVLQDLAYRDSREWANRIRPSILYSGASVAMLTIGSYLIMDQNRFSEFIYFQF